MLSKRCESTEVDRSALGDFFFIYARLFVALEIWTVLHIACFVFWFIFS